VRNAYDVSVGIPERKRQVGRLRDRWKHNIRMYLREIGCEIVDWMHLVQNRDQWRALVKTVMNHWVP
jgi:hypothetical protein